MTGTREDSMNWGGGGGLFLLSVMFFWLIYSVSKIQGNFSQRIDSRCE